MMDYEAWYNLTLTFYSLVCPHQPLIYWVSQQYLRFRESSIISKNIYIYINLFQRKTTLCIQNSLDSARHGQKRCLEGLSRDFLSRQFSKSSPVPELSRADPSPHQPYHRELTTGFRSNSSLGYLEATFPYSHSLSYPFLSHPSLYHPNSPSSDL